MDDNLLTAILIILGINVMLWLGQAAALNLNPGGPVPIFSTCNDSMLGKFDAGNCAGGMPVLDSSDPASGLPSGGGEIEVDSGNVFTDTFSAALNWFTGAVGLDYLTSILAAPSNFLEAIGVPGEFAFALGAMWYGTTLLLIVAFVLGR